MNVCSKDLEKASHVLGNIVYYCALAGPLFFTNSFKVAPRYYLVTMTMSFILTLTRGILARVWPNVNAFQRPVSHGDDGSLREKLYVGGFPSGHAFQTAFFCTMLCLAYPKWIVLLFGITGISMVGLFRYCKQFHTPLQIASGAAIGVSVAAGTFTYIRGVSTPL